MARLTIEYEGSLHKSLALMSGTLGLDMCKAFDSKPGEHSIEVLRAAETLFDDLSTLGDAIDEVAAYLEGKDLLRLSEKDFGKIDKIIRRHFNVGEVEAQTVRSFLLGKVLAEMKGKSSTVNIASLPDSIKEAIGRRVITRKEAETLRWAGMRAADLIQNISDETRHKVRQIIIDSAAKGEGHRTLRDKLFSQIEDEGELTRDWNRVAVTEANSAAQAGYLSAIGPGKRVRGYSFPDACPWCLENINGKEFEVIEDPKIDFEAISPGSAGYDEAVETYRTKVWAGKNNYGRSASKRQKVEGGFRERESHELWVPCVPAHPHCRCILREV